MKSAEDSDTEFPGGFDIRLPPPANAFQQWLDSARAEERIWTVDAVVVQWKNGIQSRTFDEVPVGATVEATEETYPRGQIIAVPSIHCFSLDSASVQVPIMQKLREWTSYRSCDLTSC
jgi:hypothetical protein